MTSIEPETTVADADGASEGAPASRSPGAAGAPAPSATSAKPPPQESPDPSDGEPEREALDGDVRELVEVAAQRDEYLALAQRTQADFENYRKRVARDSEAAHERGVIKFARELLPVIDNLDRALEEATGEDGAAPGRERAGQERPNQALLEGVRLVRSQLGAALARVGIEAFSPLGQPFDPNRQEAMAQTPAPPGAASGTVIEVYQPGYRLGETIIRPARVVVAA